MIYAIVGGIMCALLATLFIVGRVQKGGMTALYLKALASVGFVGLGLIMFFGYAPADWKSVFVILGLVMGLAGDVLLDFKVVQKEKSDTFLNWGMLAFIRDKGELPFENGDYIFIPGIQDAIKNKVSVLKAYVANKDMKEFELKLDELTDDERQIILDGCLINYYKENR